ncbi:MAG TPA: hypothetical protein VOA78_10280 [Candidatus Dormibacteraeota bacterium]|nr:hypothetical protein [Candidatus Dormibacteraeota bacterium]
MNDPHRMDALPRFLFGGESFATQSAAELKRGLIVDGIFLLLLLLGLAGAAFGQSQDQQADQKKDQKPPQQTSSQSTSQAMPAEPAQTESVADAARKSKAKKAKAEKKVYGEEDLAGMKGGVSVVGDGSVPARTSGGDGNATEVAGDRAGGAGDKNNEQEWRGRTQQIHAQMDATDEQIKALKEDIKKNGASGFDPQKGLKENVIYIDDKNARVQKLEDKKKKLEQALDELEEQGRKAGVPSEWVR